jgi:hypothetical protein
MRSEVSDSAIGRAITAPGVDAVRYVTGLQHQVLARDTIIVTE